MTKMGDAEITVNFNGLPEVKQALNTIQRTLLKLGRMATRLEKAQARIRNKGRKAVLLLAVLIGLTGTAQAVPCEYFIQPQTKADVTTWYAVSAILITAGIYTANAGMARNDIVLGAIGFSLALEGACITLELYKW